MARFKTLKRSDVKYLSWTFVIVIFFACVVLLCLQPSQQSTKLSLDSISEISRMHSVFDLNYGDTNANTTFTINATMMSNATSNLFYMKSTPINLFKSLENAKLFKDEIQHHRKTIKSSQSLSQNKNLHLFGKNLFNISSLTKNDSQNLVTLAQIKKLPSNDILRNTQLSAFINNSNVIIKEHNTSPLYNEKHHLNITPNRDKKSLFNDEHQYESNKSMISNIGESKGSNEETNVIAKLNDFKTKEKIAQNIDRKGTISHFLDIQKHPMKTFVSPFLDPEKFVFGKKFEKKVITFLQSPDVRQLSKHHKALGQCSEAVCKLIYPMPPGVRPDAVVVNSIDNTIALPVRSHPDQALVFYNMSPPTLSILHAIPSSWNSVFNWTWTYRRDSDIWQPFGVLRRIKRVQHVEHFIQLTRGKNRPIAWIPTSCSTAQKNDSVTNLVTKLKTYLPIWEFGKCHNNSCSRKGVSCSTILTKRYFFLLALEDSSCKDYITESFYRSWQDGTHIIPIVQGGTDYLTYFPEGTLIDVEWFESVKDLALFLIELMHTTKLYSHLLWRKAHWIKSSRKPNELAICSLCYKLHYLASNRKRYPDIRRWLEKSVCKKSRFIS